MKVPAQAWEPVHYSAQWTPDNPAPEWWAQFDLSWQIDRDDVMSERKLAAFLGWNRRSAVTLLQEVGAILGSREPKASQKRASTREVAVPEVIQSGEVESGESLDKRAKVGPDLSQKRAKSEPPRARVFSSPEADSDPEADSEESEIHVPPVPVSTSPPPDPEPAPCAPPPATPLSAQESTAKAATDTQPVLFGVGTAATADTHKKQKKQAGKADNHEAVVVVWTCYRARHPRSGENPPTADARLIGTALADWTPEQLCKVIEWAHTSQHKQAIFLRDGGYTAVSNLLVGSKIGIRLELAEAEVRSGPTMAHPTPDGAVFGKVVEPTKEKISALPPNLQRPEKVSGIDAAAEMWDYAQRLKTSKQTESEVSCG